jgi:hypothetical protein
VTAAVKSACRPVDVASASDARQLLTVLFASHIKDNRQSDAVENTEACEASHASNKRHASWPSWL